MDLARIIDHTLLRANATEADIQQLCTEARENNFFSVCVNPRWIPDCRAWLSGSSTLPITVVGFPLGGSDSRAKQKEAEYAVEAGAEEIDAVIDIAAALTHDWKKVEEDIKLIAKGCDRTPLKIIIETAYLNNDEIREASKCALFGGAHFVKTSTGFAPRGASEEDIKIIKEAAPTLGIKASGGIKTLAEVERLIAAGATRIGSGASVNILQEWKSK
jgi:deoxyribose-phosphate aldolase